MEKIKEYQKKVLVLGDGSVGKTSLIRRFVVDKFDDKYILTIGSKVTAKALQIDIDKNPIYLKLQIWDILGQKGYMKLYKSTFRGSKGVILVADITRKDTLISLEEYWIPTIKKIIGDIPFIILANKADLKKKAKFDEKSLYEFAEKYDAQSFITSAKTGENVETAFNYLGKTMINTKKTSYVPDSDIVIPELDDIVAADIIDKIIHDFCHEYNRPLDAMPILRRQFQLVGLDIKNPTPQSLNALIERLAAIERGFKKEGEADENRKNRLKWIREYKKKWDKA